MPQICHKHSVGLSLVCDEYVCGLCYMETVMSEKETAGKNQEFDLLLVDLGTGHHGKKIKAFRNGKEI